MTWKKPQVWDAWRIWWMISDRRWDKAWERSMVGMRWEAEGGDGLMKDWGLGWMKKRGMVVAPESTSPLHPILDSSNSFTSLARSYSYSSGASPFIVIFLFFLFLFLCISKDHLQCQSHVQYLQQILTTQQSPPPPPMPILLGTSSFALFSSSLTLL